MTSGGTRHRTTVPSPLSQSTSAVHLASEPLSSHVPRRLSRRRKTFRGLFGSDHESRATSTTGGGPSPSGHVDRTLSRKLSHTGSVIPPSIASSANSITATEASSKRRSMLGRLVKRFSLVRRSDAKSTKSSFQSFRQSADLDRRDVVSPVSRRSVSPEKPPLLQAKSHDGTRRGPTPEEPKSVQQPTDSRAKDHDAQSVLSVDNRYSMGRLTVANPDDSESIADSPETGDNFADDHSHGYGMPLRSSPELIDYSTPLPPFYGHPIRGPLSVISEGETYMSSPKMHPESSPKDSPQTPPTIPSLLSLPIRSAAMPMDRTVHAMSPPLPDLPLSPNIPEIPNSQSVVSLISPPTASAPAPIPASAPAPVPPRSEPSLPPTPHTVISRLPTPPPSDTKPVPIPALESIPERQPEPKSEPKPEFKPDPKPEHRSESRPEPQPDVSRRHSAPRTKSLASSPPMANIYQPMAAYAEESPLARASIIANPPTPYTPVVAIPSSTPPPSPRPQSQPVAQPAPHSDEPSSQAPQNDSAKKDGFRRTRSKHTETFKLARTPSGHVEGVPGSFVVDGEHWHVVESPKEESSKKSRRDRESSDDRDRTSRRRSKRAEREGTSEDSERKYMLEPVTQPNGHSRGIVEPPQQHTRVVSGESHKRSESRHSRERQDAVRSTQTPVVHASKGHASTNSSVSGFRERTSVMASTRPSSEFQSVADMNTLRAKDAWEIERLWKGRSMVTPDGAALNGARPNIGSDSRPSTIMSHEMHRASTIPSVGDGNTVLSTYGSSHTTFTIHEGTVAYPPNGTARTSTITLPPLPPLSTSHNPLPEPPRMSSYKPAPLPVSIAAVADTKPSTDLWNRYTGVTVTH